MELGDRVTVKVDKYLYITSQAGVSVLDATVIAFQTNVDYTYIGWRGDEKIPVAYTLNADLFSTPLHRVIDNIKDFVFYYPFTSKNMHLFLSVPATIKKLSYECPCGIARVRCDYHKDG